MFVTIVDNRVDLTLSRQNVRQLAAMLDQPEGNRMCLARKDESGVSLFVHAQSDADHYDGRDPDPEAQAGCDLREGRVAARAGGLGQIRRMT
jgi:hypothetical protein